MIKKIIDRLKIFLRNIAKKNKYLDYFAHCYQLRKNRFFISCLNNPQKILLLDKKGIGIPKTNIMHLKYYTNFMSMGFCAILRELLDSFFVCNLLNSKPYIEILDNNNNNVFDDFFCQPCSKNEFENSCCIIKPNGLKAGFLTRSIFEIDKINNGHNCYDNSNTNYLKELAFLWRKYFIFKEDIQDNLHKNFSKLIEIPEKTLAIHYRGTDFKVGFAGHPIALSVSDYYEYIDKCLKNGFEKIFLATDDANALKEFKERYPNHIIYYSDAFRSSNGFAVQSQKNNRCDNDFLIRYEVIRDFYTMANCAGLVCGLSNVSLMTRIFKLSLNKEWSYLHIINNGFINKNDYSNQKEYINKLSKYNKSISI